MESQETYHVIPLYLQSVARSKAAYFTAESFYEEYFTDIQTPEPHISYAFRHLDGEVSTMIDKSGIRR